MLLDSSRNVDYDVGDNVGDYVDYHTAWWQEKFMIKTIQMTLDERLLERLDAAVTETKTNRSAFIRDAVEMALKQLRIHRMEAQQIAGYEALPTTEEEIEEWNSIRAWGEP